MALQHKSIASCFLATSEFAGNLDLAGSRIQYPAIQMHANICRFCAPLAQGLDLCLSLGICNPRCHPRKAWFGVGLAQLCSRPGKVEGAYGKRKLRRPRRFAVPSASSRSSSTARDESLVALAKLASPASREQMEGLRQWCRDER